MKFLLSCFCLFWVLSAKSQTKYIAFKSHAGDMDFFLPDEQPEDDFGLPAAQMHKIKKINYYTVVEYAREYGSDYEMTDTVVNQIYCKNPNIDLDSLKKLYPQGIEFEGFDNKTSKTEKKELQHEEKGTLEKEIKEKKSKKKKETDKAELPVSLPTGGNNDGNAPLFVIICAIYAIIIVSIAAGLIKGKRNSMA